MEWAEDGTGGGWTLAAGGGWTLAAGEGWNVGKLQMQSGCVYGENAIGLRLRGKCNRVAFSLKSSNRDTSMGWMHASPVPRRLKRLFHRDD